MLNNKGLALDELGNHTGAISYYDKALAIDSHHINTNTTLSNKGASLEELANYTGAMLYFNKALAIGPHNIHALKIKP